MDCFFAAVEARDNPEYRGVPLIVGGPRGTPRAVVSTCSYEARKFGVHSAMPISQAERLCPQGVFIEGRMSRYAQVSREIMETLQGFTPVMQQVSIDEAYLDMTGCEHFYRDCEHMGDSIREAVRRTSGLAASVGIGPSKYISKLASSRAKPDGLLIVAPEEVDAFLLPMPVSSLWGVGQSGRQSLERYGICTVADLRAWPREWLIQRFGKWGATIFELSRGIDNEPVVSDEEMKSMGSESTFDSDINDRAALCKSLAHHTSKVGSRLRQAGQLARTVTVKVKFADFQQITRSRSLPEPFDDDDTIYSVACSIIADTDLAQPVRLIGLSVSGFSTGRQLSLFEFTDSSVDHVLDEIARKHGARIAVRGRDLDNG